MSGHNKLGPELSAHLDPLRIAEQKIEALTELWYYQHNRADSLWEALKTLCVATSGVAAMSTESKKIGGRGRLGDAFEAAMAMLDEFSPGPYSFAELPTPPEVEELIASINTDGGAAATPGDE